MKIDILRQRENKVLNRREIDFRIDHVGGTTPSRADIRAKLAAQLDSDLSAVVIRRIKSRYGIGITEGIARIYKDSDHAKSIEIGYVLKRHEPKKKEAGEVAEKPTEGAEGKAAEKAEKKKPEKEAEKAEKRPEKGTEKVEKKPEKEAEKAEKRPEKGTEKAEKKPEKKRAEAADEEES